MIMRKSRPSDGQKNNDVTTSSVTKVFTYSQIGLSNMYKVLCKSLVL